MVLWERAARSPPACRLVVVARNASGLRQFLVLDRRLQHRAVPELVDDAALDLLPWRLVRRVLVAAHRSEVVAPLFELVLGDQDVGLTGVEIDPHPVAGAKNRQIATRRR